MPRKPGYRLPNGAYLLEEAISQYGNTYILAFDPLAFQSFVVWQRDDNGGLHSGRYFNSIVLAVKVFEKEAY